MHDSSFVRPPYPSQVIKQCVQQDYVNRKDGVVAGIQNSHRRVEVWWMPPPQGWVRINTDGAVKGETGLVGCGGLLRDDGSAGFLSSWEEPLLILLSCGESWRD